LPYPPLLSTEHVERHCVLSLCVHALVSRTQRSQPAHVTVPPAAASSDNSRMVLRSCTRPRNSGPGRSSKSWRR
jgi:hypothetical protein